MILGIGTDIVAVSRIRKMLNEHSESFLSRVFTDIERKEGAKKANRAEYFAGRWAVKEAASKALGCGLGRSCSWKDISTTNDGDGRPHIFLSGNAGEHADKAGVFKLHASISHEKEYANATVIMEGKYPHIS